MKLYHRTTRPAARVILRDGFLDATGPNVTSTKHTGVWLSSKPPDANEHTVGNTFLVVTGLDTEAIGKFELLEMGKPYREWLVPAEIVNGGTVTILGDEDEL